MTIYLCDRALVGGVVRERVAITVTDGWFTAIEPDAVPDVARDDAAVRLRGLTIAGMANAHSHAFHRALRSRTQTGDGSFWTWRAVMFAASAHLDPDSYHRLARATFAEMLLAGITTVGEFHYVHHQPDGTPYADPNAMGEALLAAADEAGIRITLLDTLYLHGGLSADRYAPPAGPQLRYTDHTPEGWIHRVDQLVPGERQRIGAAVHSVRAVDPDSMTAVAHWAERHGAPLHAHVSEQPAENEQCHAHHGVTPTRLLHDAGVLGARFTAVHATHLTGADVALLAGSGTTVCLCPTTERDLGDGIGPSTELAVAGVPMAVGSDSHATIDLFEECRAVELDERLRSGRRGAHSAASLLAMATEIGHRSLGWSDAGAIAVGNRADLVTVDLGSVRTAGASPSTAVEAAVFAAGAADVTDVIVDGVPVVVGRQHHLDVAAELHAAITGLLGP